MKAFLYLLAVVFVGMAIWNAMLGGTVMESFLWLCLGMFVLVGGALTRRGAKAESAEASKG